jgi:PLP dependent protein
MTPPGPGALAPGPPPDVVVERLAGLRRRIEAAGADPEGVRIVAVTKGFDFAAVEAAMRAGLVDIGENRVDELLAKAARGSELAGTPCWHYLGAIQRRRVPALAPVVGLWQTVARLVEGAAIATHAPGAPVLVQVDAAGRPGQNGCPIAEVPRLVEDLRALALEVRGLMLLAPRGEPTETRRVMRAVADTGRALGLAELSMGMTDDLDEAVSEGATIVRIGRGLFGERPPGAR